MSFSSILLSTISSLPTPSAYVSPRQGAREFMTLSKTISKTRCLVQYGPKSDFSSRMQATLNMMYFSSRPKNISSVTTTRSSRSLYRYSGSGNVMLKTRSKSNVATPESISSSSSSSSASFSEIASHHTYESIKPSMSPEHLSM